MEGKKMLLIDTVECPVGHLAAFIRTVVKEEWEAFATLLGIDKKETETMKAKWKNNEYVNYDEFIKQILLMWKKQNEGKASLGRLVQIVEARWGSATKPEKGRAKPLEIPTPTLGSPPIKRKRANELKPQISPPGHSKRDEPHHQPKPGHTRSRKDYSENSIQNYVEYWAEGKQKASAERSRHILIKDLKLGKRYERDILLVRVTYVSELLPGSIFRFHVMDRKKEEIKVVACKRTAYKFHSFVKVNGLYEMRNFKVEHDMDKYPSRLRHTEGMKIYVEDYRQMVIVNAESFPHIPFKFTRLDELPSTEFDGRFDILAIVFHVYDLEETDDGVKRRRFTLTDDSMKYVEFNMWGCSAEAVTKADSEFKVVAVRHGEMTKNGDGEICTTNHSPETLVWFQPDLEEARKLSQWFDGIRPVKPQHYVESTSKM